MGYKPASRIYNLTFVDYPGLEISARSTSLGSLTRLTQLRVNVANTNEVERMEVFEFFASKVIAWNIEHPETDTDGACSRCGLTEGTPLPVSTQGLLCLDMDFIMHIIIGWMEAVSKVTPGKSPSSNNGANAFQEELMKELGTKQSPLISSTPN